MGHETFVEVEEVHWFSGHGPRSPIGSCTHEVPIPLVSQWPRPVSGGCEDDPPGSGRGDAQERQVRRGLDGFPIAEDREGRPDGAGVSVGWPEPDHDFLDHARVVEAVEIEGWVAEHLGDQMSQRKRESIRGRMDVWRFRSRRRLQWCLHRNGRLWNWATQSPKIRRRMERFFDR